MSVESNTEILDEDTHEVSSGHESLTTTDLTLLFIMLTLFMGLVCKEINKKIGIPYTPLLIVTGALFGATKFWGKISESTENSKNIAPHDILQLLLPILLFESAYNAHIEVLTKNLWQVVILIGPAVLVSCFLLGVIIKYILGYSEMDYATACVLGSILSSTDPVAVVALLKELGAPMHTETLIEMESLFNDGTSMVFFLMFQKIATGSSATFGDAIVSFIQLAFGGLFLGVIMGGLALFFTHFFTRGKTLFISLIIILSYLTFFIAEKFELGVSGLLGLVASGLLINLYMKDYMTTEQRESVHTILSYLQYVAETILFFLSGIFMGSILFRQKDLIHDQSQGLNGSDWGLVIALYIFVILSRGAIILGCYPMLQRTGQGLDMKELIVSVWGGLRGALSLALALIVFSDEDSKYQKPFTERIKNLILFHTCGVAILTLLVNGTTCGYVLQKVNLITNGAIKMNFKKFYLRKLQEQAKKSLNEMKQSDYFDLVVWESVDQLVDQKMFDNEFQQLQIQEQQFYLKRDKKNLNLEGVNIERIRYDQLRNFMNFLTLSKGNEWISGKNYQLIFDAAEESTEQLDQKINMWHYIHFEMMPLDRLEKFKLWKHLPVVGKIFDYWRHYQLNHQHELIYIFCTTLAQCIETSKQLLNDDYQTQHGLNYQALIPRVIDELRDEWNIARNHLNQLKKNFPEVLCKLEQRKAAMRILMSQAKQIDEDVSNHYIPESDGISLKSMLSQKLQHIMSFQTLYKLTTLNQEIMANTFKNILQDHEIEYLRDNSQIVSFSKGAKINSKGVIADYIYILSSGEAEEIIPIQENDASDSQLERLSQKQPKKFNITQGQIIGLANLIDERKESLIDVEAINNCECRQIDIMDLRYLFNENEKFESWCYKKSLYQFIQMYHSQDKLSTLSKEEITDLANLSDLQHLDPFDLNQKIYTFPYGAFLFQGKIYNQEKDSFIEGFHLIQESNSTFQIVDESLILVFKPIPVKVQNKQRYQGAKQKQRIQYNPEGFNAIPTSKNQLQSIEEKKKNFVPAVDIQGKSGFKIYGINQPCGDSDRLDKIDASQNYAVVDQIQQVRRQSQISGKLVNINESFNQSYQLYNDIQDNKTQIIKNELQNRQQKNQKIDSHNISLQKSQPKDQVEVEISILEPNKEPINSNQLVLTEKKK